MALDRRCVDRVCTVIDVRSLLRRARYCRSCKSARYSSKYNILEASSSPVLRTRQRRPSPSKLIRRVSCRSSSRARVEVRDTVVRERAAEGLQYERVIAHEGGKRGGSSRVTLGQVWWYLFAFDLVNLLAAPLVLASSGGTAAVASGSGSSSTMVVRRSPKQTMHDSAMLGGCWKECHNIMKSCEHRSFRLEAKWKVGQRKES